jgi:alkylation response protein AidB-like acyl-CoA dehydrogenase
LDFAEPEHITMIRENVRRFIEGGATPDLLRKWDKEDRIPIEVHRRIDELGVCGLTVPEAYGGSGLDLIAMTAVIEELANRLGLPKQ